MEGIDLQLKMEGIDLQLNGKEYTKQKEPVLVIQKTIISSAINKLEKSNVLNSDKNISRVLLDKSNFISKSTKVYERDYESDIEEIPEQWELDVSSTLHSDYSDIIAEYHVVYSHNWKCPVLYFVLYNQDGSSLSLDYVKNILTSKNAIKSQDSTAICLDALIPSNDFGSIIGICDHPFLGTPYYFLHPCETHTLLKSVDESQLITNIHSTKDESKETIYANLENYLLIWIGLAGPPVMLYLPQKLMIAAWKNLKH
ncbi:hypothetical protein BB561_002279 [Smittium simulii]|uniref:Ubiquitin-like-conjugating enzyme ATG10 n=1 Tax=Smittium simulii TaxID=133385 RepID=A0A2T9YR86_9FUNG|nr:hypothetical protein BB561_002279 [Smittium simulii]